MRQLIAVLVVATLAASAAEETVAPLGKYTTGERRHWAFQPLRNNLPPATIDSYILAGLDKAKLSPAPEADRATLIRRATYDLHGLPPTPAEIKAFVADPSPKAYENLIERLLASPRYGEQWARHWLDVVRFAESDGYEYDTHRPDAYRYRDYVIQSFPQDKPYNQFIKEQLAGDEAEPATPTLLIASGFNRLGPLRKNAGNQEVASSRNEVLTEMTNIVGAAFLGVTVGCARCHDHKFDPFRQSDYYRIQGYFSQTHSRDVIIATPEQQAAHKAILDPIEAEIKTLRANMRKASEEEKGKIQLRLEALDEKMPPPLEAYYAVTNNPKELTPIHLLGRGDYRSKGAKVGMRPLGILLPETEPELPIDANKPRTQLANWITDPANPLTARVMVNRIWGYHFGTGLVSTPNDFGRMGTRPTHPELLDYLANQFIAGGWQIKPMHRLMMLSSTYRQASQSPNEKAFSAIDPANKLLWKFNRRRLDAEELRDSILAVTGKLNLKAGGPSVMASIDPELIKDLKRPQYWVTTKDRSEHMRRTIYMIYKRNLILPFMQVFDSPDTLLSCARRDQSTHAPQALELMNGDFTNTLAKDLAIRIKAEGLDQAFQLIAGRAPNPKERALSMKYLDDPDPAALTEFALTLLNSNAFLYVN
ncbi:MAG: DUF1549 and DUF1553 domain-containing protein [Acidobacteria bacterium]|nr:DUF1549 and DUF1553 domain-containing protein [Acidobacteriota bacterium]